MSEEIKIKLVDSNGHVYGDMDGNSEFQLNLNFDTPVETSWGIYPDQTTKDTFTFDAAYPSEYTFSIGDMSMEKEIDYAFNEKELLEEMQSYIDGTYNAHYSQDKYQSTEIIEDMGHGMGFALGNVIKYCQRYGKKAGYNRDDLKKVIHYGIIALAMHDRKE